MTTTQEAITSTSPHTPLLLRAARIAGVAARTSWRLARTISIPVRRSMAVGSTWTLTAVWRRPMLSVVLVAAAIWLTPITWRHVTGVVFLVLLSMIMSGEIRVRISTLPAVSRFRKRQRRIRRRWVQIMEDAGLSKPSKWSGGRKRTPRLRRVTQTPVGVRVVAAGSGVSAGVGAFSDKADKLRSGLAARDVIVAPEPGRPHLTRLEIIYDDPFRRMIYPRDLPRPSRDLHVVVGFDSFGRPVEKDLRLPNLVIGMQGSGKSSEVWRILQGLQEAGIHHRVRVFDPKGGQEFADLEGAAYYYERNPTEWGSFLEYAFGALKCRQGVLRAAGLRKNDFTEDNPLDVMIIDELVTVMALSDSKTKIEVFGKSMPLDKAFMVYLSTARSAGFTVLACSQLPQKSTLGDARDLFGYVTCLRVLSDDAVRVAGLDPKLFPAHELPRTEETAGIGFMSTEAGVVKYRAAYLNDRARTGVARKMTAETARYRRAEGE